MSSTFEESARRLLRRTVLGLAVCGAAVVACFYWVDRSVAFYVHDHELDRIAVFRWLTYPPPMVQAWSPLLLVALAVRRAFGPLNRCQKAVFVACISLIAADQFRTSAGDVCGRYWPETWFDHNPSLIGTGTYGFHPFQHGDDIGSFPSGHATRILGFAGVLWLACPRWRWICAAACAPMLVSLVAMNYHFVGDVIAGGALGAVVAAVAGYLAGFERLSYPARSP